MGAKVGRPSKYSQPLVDEICTRLAEGESLRTICLDDKMPSIGAVLRWVGENEEFRQQYARARQAQAEAYVAEISDIADDGSNDYKTVVGADGKEKEVFDAEHVQRSRLRIDTRKWIACKVLPKVYGEKLELAGEMKQTHEVGDSITNLVANLRKTRGK